MKKEPSRQKPAALEYDWPQDCRHVGRITATTFAVSMDGTHDQNGDSLTYQIAWGDGVVTNAQSGNHSYATPGGYTVTATATDQHGASESKTQQVLVDNQAPAAQLSVSPTEGTTATTFSASMEGSSDPDGDALTYRIEWGDGSTTNSIEGTHSYSSPGGYTITGTVTDSRGASTSKSQAIQVNNRAPGLVFDVSPNEGTTDTIFTASMSGTTDPDGDALSYRIDWDDGTSSNNISGTHQYGGSGTYTVTGIAMDAYGETSSSSETITVCELIANGMCVAQPDINPMRECDQSGACPTFPEPPDDVPSAYSQVQQAADPDDGLGLAEERDVTVVSLNIGNNSTPGDVARRIKKLASKNASTSPGDGIARIPDVIVLQEATKVEAGQIADVAGTQVLGDGPTENGYVVGAGEGSGSPGTIGNTAIIYRKATVDPVAPPSEIRTFYKASDIPAGTLTFTDPDTGEVIACPQNDGFRRHWMRQFKTKVSGFGVYTFTVASIHLLTKGCLKDSLEADLYDNGRPRSETV